MSLNGVIERVTRAQQPIAFLKRLAVDAGPELVIQLADEVPRRARSNLDEARRLARAAPWPAPQAGAPPPSAPPPPAARPPPAPRGRDHPPPPRHKAPLDRVHA